MENNKTEFTVKGEQLLEKIKQLLHEGNIRRIIIKDVKGNIFMEIPLTIGVVGTALLPVLAAVGALAALVSDFTIQIIKRDDPDIK
ncbi:MAG TPA: DUF4342 domain-containing protein [Bacteroidales bacterium]|nr:DUF4342 domain-containing protein [Bacteroidales bacterium]HPI30836.1 DUF4342 domain-containing protein [Bacteroidales bacterium]HQN16474.1 DUF4342 domain-containing protein [Bacteroidales bacterium]HQP16362.1 DUF4342 domain-containing protein [Bacteroidales bacterium]